MENCTGEGEGSYVDSGYLAVADALVHAAPESVAAAGAVDFVGLKSYIHGHVLGEGSCKADGGEKYRGKGDVHC